MKLFQAAATSLVPSAEQAIEAQDAVGALVGNQVCAGASDIPIKVRIPAIRQRQVCVVRRTNAGLLLETTDK